MFSFDCIFIYFVAAGQKGSFFFFFYSDVLGRLNYCHLLYSLFLLWDGQMWINQPDDVCHRFDEESETVWNTCRFLDRANTLSPCLSCQIPYYMVEDLLNHSFTSSLPSSVWNNMHNASSNSNSILSEVLLCRASGYLNLKSPPLHYYYYYYYHYYYYFF